MDRVVTRFRSPEAAEQADRAYYASLTGQQRLDICLELITRGTPHETGQGLARTFHTQIPAAQPHSGRVPMSGLWRTARCLVLAGGNGADGPEWRGRFLPESLFTVFPSRCAGAVRSSPHFQRFSSAREAPSRWVYYYLFNLTLLATIFQAAIASVSFSVLAR